MPTARTSLGASDDGLPLMLCQIEALQLFARMHGSRRKSRLRVEWSDATADPLLHQLRNTHGPAWLERYRLPKSSPAGLPSLQHL